MSVAKVSEIIASSKKSFEDAIDTGVKRANKTLKSQPAVRAAGTKTQCGSAIIALCFCPLA